MKNKITALALITATVFSLAPKPAKAGDKEWALVGGLVGGLIIGSALNDSRNHADYYPTRSTTLIVRDREDRCDDGYWKEVSVKVWVPGCWVVERHHGRLVRRYVGGHYTYRTDRVREDHDRHDHDDRYDGDGRYDRAGRHLDYGRDR